MVEGGELAVGAGQLRARIVQRDRDGRVLGTRDLEATSCEELRRSATFVVFLIVDPDAAFGGPGAMPVRPEAEGDEEHSSEREPSRANGEASRVSESSRKEASRSRPSEATGAAHPPAVSAAGVRMDLGLSLVVSNGLLPKPDVGPALTLGIAPPGLPLRFEWRTAYRIAVEPVERYDFRAVGQEWRGCYVRRVFDATFGTVCGGVAWMAILPDARGLAGGDQAPKTVLSPTFAVGPAFDLKGTRLFVDLALAIPWPRYAFSYGEEGREMRLHEVSRIVWSFGIGAAQSFL